MPKPPTLTTTGSAGADPSKELRGAVRTVLSTLKEDRAAPVSWLQTLIRKHTGIAANEEQVLKALNWNADKGFVTYRYNQEMEWDEWYLTTRGKQEEGIK